METVARITSKGQVTIPKKMRDILGSDVVRLRVEDGKIILEPVRDLGGVFKRYARGGIPFEKEREMAWGRVAGEHEENS